MFERSLIDSDARSDPSQKPATFSVSIALHAIAMVVLLVVPLTRTAAVPAVLLARPIIPLDPGGKTDAPADAPAQSQVIRTPRLNRGDLVAPVAIPNDIAHVEAPVMLSIPPMETGQGSVASIIGTLTPRDPPAPPSPAPPEPPAAPMVRSPIRYSAGVVAANLVHRVEPVYPPLARIARVQGAVVLEAVINKEGEIDNLRVITGPPLLVRAAIDAVSQWRYKPTMLNGEAIQVLTTITVNFIMRQ
jgi:protein TonB